MGHIARSAALAAAVGLATAFPTHAADNDNGKFKVDPGVFIGKAGDCGLAPGSKIVGAAWVKDIGLADEKGHDSEGLILSKNGPSTDCSAAGATLKGVQGITLIEIGFDIRNGGHCGAGAPRFNVVASDGFHFLGGCANATQTPNFPQPGWTRIRIDPSNAAQAFPEPIAPGATIVSIDIVFDEGVEVGPDFSGMAIIDNISVNGVLVGRR